MTATTTTTVPVTTVTPEAKRIATSAARAVLKSLPEHTFNTGATGRDLKTRVIVGGETFFVAVQVVHKPKTAAKKTVAKKAPAKKAVAKKAPAKPVAKKV